MLLRSVKLDFDHFYGGFTMSYEQLQENWQTFTTLIDKLPVTHDAHKNRIVKNCIEQNSTILNDIFVLSIEHLKNLQKMNSVNEIICTQAKLTQKISQKLTHAAQHFLHASLENITDHNEWLKTHCDLATD
jgi:hypothetical protein